jgi:hypothetical protein
MLRLKIPSSPSFHVTTNIINVFTSPAIAPSVQWFDTVPLVISRTLPLYQTSSCFNFIQNRGMPSIDIHFLDPEKHTYKLQEPPSPFPSFPSTPFSIHQTPQTSNLLPTSQHEALHSSLRSSRLRRRRSPITSPTLGRYVSFNPISTLNPRQPNLGGVEVCWGKCRPPTAAVDMHKTHELTSPMPKDAIVKPNEPPNDSPRSPHGN